MLNTSQLTLFCIGLFAILFISCSGNVIILLLENLILLISNRGLFFDFNNYDYILFDILNNDTIEEVYFIKLKNKIDKKYFSIWLFHKDNMFEYII